VRSSNATEVSFLCYPSGNRKITILLSLRDEADRMLLVASGHSTRTFPVSEQISYTSKLQTGSSHVLICMNRLVSQIPPQLGAQNLDLFGTPLGKYSEHKKLTRIDDSLLHDTW